MALKNAYASSSRQNLLHLYREQILPFGVEEAQLAGMLMDRAVASGHAPDSKDATIAGTAMFHGYIILSTDTRRFGPLTIGVANLFEIAIG